MEDFDVMNAFLDVIASGVEVLNPINIISDIGTTVFKAGEFAVTAGAGAAATVASIVDGAAATALTQGIALATMEVSTAAIAAAPALGIAAGVGLYNLAPDFWTKLSNELVAAGKTIGGRVTSFLGADGKTYLDTETLDIIKNAFIDEGYFKTGDGLNVDSVNKNNLWFQYTDYSNIYKYSLPISFNSKRKIDDKNYTFTSQPYIDGLSWSLVEFYVGDIEYATSRRLILFSNKKVPEIATQFVLYKADSVAYSRTYPSGLYELKVNDGLGTIVYMDHTTNTAFNSDDFYIEGINISKLHTNDENFAIGKGCTDYIYLALNGQVDSSDSVGVLQPGAIYPTKGQSITDTYQDWLSRGITIPTATAGEDVIGVPIAVSAVDGTQGTIDQQLAQNPISVPTTKNPDLVGDLIDWMQEILKKVKPIDNATQEVPKVDTDTQPTDITEPVIDTVIDQVDPIIPNPPIPTPTPPNLPTNPSSRLSNALYTVYNPSGSQIDRLGAYLWNNDIIESLKKIWQDPMDGIISLRKVYCVPSTGGNSTIKLGTLDTEISSPVVSSQFVSLDCGTISLNEIFGNVLDYSPYTQLHLYLPFVGIVEINVNEFMQGSINIIYKFDVYTGSFLVEVRATRTIDMPSPVILYTFSGNASQAIPLTATQFQGAISSVLGVATGAITLATGGGLAPVWGAAQIANSLNHEMIHINHASSLSANSGILASRYPQLIVSRHKPFDANSYSGFYGYPTNKTMYLSNCSGFTRVKAIHLNSKATQNEKNEIEALLKEGVII